MTTVLRTQKPRRWLPWLFVAAGVLIFAAANAHLIYVAFQSQPDCVDHVKHGDEGYSAAKSAC